MANINVTLPDKSILKLEKGASVMDAAKKIGAGLAKAALAAKVDGRLVDMSFKLVKDCRIEILTAKDQEGRIILSHTAGHILAQAVKRLYPGAKLGHGPGSENKFFHDFEPAIIPYTRRGEGSIRSLLCLFSGEKIGIHGSEKLGRDGKGLEYDDPQGEMRYK